MPPPNQLSIATSSLNRLVKEEASYHHEHEQQRARIAKLEAADGEAEAEGEEGNREFEVKQQKQGLAETEAMFPQLRMKIQDALQKLEQQLEQDKGPGDQSTPDDITKAKEAIAAGLKAVREVS